jgi:hypothetical protein
VMNINELKNYQDIETLRINYPQFSENQWRWIAVNKERYDLAHAIKKIGRKLYFHVPSLISWIEKQDA